jgi:hypothetical protein
LSIGVEKPATVTASAEAVAAGQGAYYLPAGSYTFTATA